MPRQGDCQSGWHLHWHFKMSQMCCSLLHQLCNYCQTQISHKVQYVSTQAQICAYSMCLPPLVFLFLCHRLDPFLCMSPRFPTAHYSSSLLLLLSFLLCCSLLCPTLSSKQIARQSGEDVKTKRNHYSVSSCSVSHSDNFMTSLSPSLCLFLASYISYLALDVCDGLRSSNESYFIGKLLLTQKHKERTV